MRTEQKKKKKRSEKNSIVQDFCMEGRNLMGVKVQMYINLFKLDHFFFLLIENHRKILSEKFNSFFFLRRFE